MNRVLTPRFERTGETVVRKDGCLMSVERVAEWIEIGQAETMAEAKAKFGGAPVLQHINPKSSQTAIPAPFTPGDSGKQGWLQRR